MPSPTLDEWLALIRRYVDGSLASAEFAAAYFALYERADVALARGEPWTQPDEAQRILYRFALKVDSLESAKASMTDDKLRETARGVLGDLERVAAGSFRRPGPMLSALRLVIVSILLVGQAALFAAFAVWRGVRWPVARTVSLLRRG